MGDKKTGMAAWAAAAEGYALPAWEQLPGIPLYMDQVTMVTGEALALFERDEKQSLLTSSMVNNYVKNGVVEHPVHKKYMREHLVKLMMTSLLKQVLSIQDISVLFPAAKLPNSFTRPLPPHRTARCTKRRLYYRTRRMKPSCAHRRFG